MAFEHYRVFVNVDIAEINGGNSYHLARIWTYRRCTTGANPCGEHQRVARGRRHPGQLARLVLLVLLRDRLLRGQRSFELVGQVACLGAPLGVNSAAQAGEGTERPHELTTEEKTAAGGTAPADAAPGREQRRNAQRRNLKKGCLGITMIWKVFVQSFSQIPSVIKDGPSSSKVKCKTYSLFQNLHTFV